MQCRCTRNTSCSKPAGHPGFCSGPRAAAAETPWHSRQGSPRAGARFKPDGSPQRPSRSSHRLLPTPSSQPDAECPKTMPSENPDTCEEPAAVTLDMKAEAHSLHDHRPRADIETEGREGGSAQPIAHQHEPSTVPPGQAGTAQAGRPFVSLARHMPIRTNKMLPSVRQTTSMHKASDRRLSAALPFSLQGPLQACPCCSCCRHLRRLAERAGES